jgi:molybdate transport system ATP-binding protein
MTFSVDVALRRGSFELRAKFESDALITALFGRSGAGKTTLVNVIAGLERCDRGRVVIGGHTLLDSANAIDLPTHRRRIGYVFQEGRLLPHFTVRQNLLYGRFFSRQYPSYVELDHLVELLGLGALLERRPAALSGGEKQRVAIGRALLASPRLLLMDEPLAALDAQRKNEIMQYIELLNEELHIPIVYVTHSIDEIVRLADNVVVMADGTVVASGKVSEVMGRPELRARTGRFEGGAVIEAKVAAHDLQYDLTRLTFAGGELIAGGVDALIGERVRVRVRARDVAIALAPPADISVLNVLRGTIAAISSDSGPSANVRIDMGEVTLMARVTRLSVERLRLQVGLQVYALVKAISLDRHGTGFT